MNSIYKGKYTEIFVDLDRSLIFDTWTEASKDMEDAEFIQFTDIWTDIVIKFKIQYALTDTLNLRFTLTPDVQEIASQKIKKAVESGLKKQAMIAPQTEDLFTKVALDQTVEEIQISTGFLVTQIFPSPEEAEKWLLS